MTKKDIVKTISEKINMTQLTTKGIVQETFDTIVETLVREGRIELRNFGVFEAKERAARKARNPRTSERVDVPSKIVVTFKPGKRMAERVKNMDPAVLVERDETLENSEPAEQQPAPHGEPLGSYESATQPALASDESAATESAEDSTIDETNPPSDPFKMP